MKYTSYTAVLVPYTDDNDKPNWIRLGFTGTVDHRRLLRTVRAFIQASFNLRVDNDFVKKYCKIYPAQGGLLNMCKDEKRAFMDNLVYNLQKVEDEYAATQGGYSTGEDTAFEEAKVEVSSVQRQPAEQAPD